MNSIRLKLLLWLLPGLGILWGTAGTAIYLTVESSLQSQLDAELQALSHGARFFARPSNVGPPNGGPSPDRFRESATAGFHDPTGDIYFQLWHRNGTVLSKSKSLGKGDLVVPKSLTEHGDFFDAVLDDGTKVRLWASKVPFSPRGRAGKSGYRGGPPWERLREMTRGTNGVFPDLDEVFGRRPGPQNNREPERGRHPDEEGPRGDRGRDDGFGRGPDRRGPPEVVNLVVAKDRTQIDGMLGTLLGGITGSGLAAAFLSILLVRLALKSGLQPLEVVGEQAAKIDAGSLDRRFPTEGLPTELSPIANRLNDLMVRMEESFERERRFSADLAHELRTPVAELKSMSEVAIKWPEQADAKTDYQDVQDISERMQATIENLLMLTRLENSKARINREPVDLRSFVASCRKPFQANAEDRKIEFKDGIGKEESIESDGKLLRIVLENLISNAIEYAPKNSAIELSGRCETNRAQVFAIQNPAPDLTAADATHLFERLWRKDTSRTDDRHCGLGLSLAKSCADQLGLELRAEKREDRLRFTLTAPEAGDAGTDSA